MSEASEQRAVVEYCDFKKIPVFHIPNGGYRNKAEAAHLKAQGVRPGVPDLCVPVARHGYHGLYIEMKRRRTAGVGVPAEVAGPTARTCATARMRRSGCLTST